MAVTAVKTLCGLAAIVLLARIARALAPPALRLHAHLSDRVRGNRIATQLSRVGAGLPTLLPWLAGWFGLDLLGWFFYRYEFVFLVPAIPLARLYICLLYTSDAADARSMVDLGGPRHIKKKNKHSNK